MVERTDSNNRYWAIAYHWLDMFFLMISIGLLFILIHPLLEKWLANPFFCSLSGNGGLCIIYGFFACLILWHLIYQLGSRQLVNNKAPFDLPHPALWPLGAIVFLMYYFARVILIDKLLLFDELVRSKELATVLACFLVSGLVYSFAVWVIKHKEEKPKDKDDDKAKIADEPTSFEEIAGNFEKLTKWIQSETPITSVEQDLFDMQVFAKKIFHILTDKAFQTVGIVGPYGCGKSSVIKLVEYYLENPSEVKNSNTDEEQNKPYPAEKIIHCEVSGWGFVEGSAAEHILNTAINELSLHVDCSSLKSVPRNYQRALSANGNIFMQILSALLTRWQSPLDVLRQVDNLLARIDRRLVVFLEDIDRNKREDVFFNEIAALLDGLKELNNISFVLAIGADYAE